jgi:hypothetical protein
LKGFDDVDNIARRLVETSLPKSKSNWPLQQQ